MLAAAKVLHDRQRCPDRASLLGCFNMIGLTCGRWSLEGLPRAIPYLDPRYATGTASIFAT